MGDISYKFKVKLGNFEFEVEGDKSFVEKTMTRYEGRFLPRFQQFMNNIQFQQATTSVSISGPENQKTQQPQKQQGQNPQTTEQTQRPSQDSSHDSKKDKSRRPRGRKRPRNNSSTWVKPAPVLPKSQEVARVPYLPDDVDTGGKVKEKPQSKTGESSNDETQSSGDKTAATKLGKVNVNILKQNFNKLSPRTHHEKMLVFGYSINQNDENSYFTSNEIRECYSAVGADSAGNISQVLNHATRTGFLNKTQRGRQVRYSITSKGKHFVERGLSLGD